MDASVVTHSHAQRRAMRRDLQRYIRVVQSFDFSGVAENGPVEITELCRQRQETDEVRLLELLVSKRPLQSLTIRLHLYDRQNVPMKATSAAAADGTLGLRSGIGRRRAGRRVEPVLIHPGETFGRASYIRLPARYFKRLTLELVSAVYADGVEETLGCILSGGAKRLSEADIYTQRAFVSKNVFRAAEEAFPSVYVPESGGNSWLCCCGQKNLASEAVCTRCSRERDWVLTNLNEQSLASEREGDRGGVRRAAQERVPPEPLSRNRRRARAEGRSV
ncbi:MAG: hypothetical protein ACLUFV_05420 [Acutalibacteraceae bacterium]